MFDLVSWFKAADEGMDEGCRVLMTDPDMARFYGSEERAKKILKPVVWTGFGCAVATAATIIVILVKGIVKLVRKKGA